jgi:hypothetical protein
MLDKRTMIKINDLLSRKIDWIQTGEEKWILHADADGMRIHLRLNDFPVENICTVFIGEASYELESIPSAWTLPAHRGVKDE